MNVLRDHVNINYMNPDLRKAKKIKTLTRTFCQLSSLGESNPLRLLNQEDILLLLPVVDLLHSLIVVLF